MDSIKKWLKSAQARPDNRITLEGATVTWDPVSLQLGLSHPDHGFALSLPLSKPIGDMLTNALAASGETARKDSISDATAKEIATRLMAGKGVEGKDWNYDWDGKTLVLGVYNDGQFVQTRELDLDELKKSFPNASQLV